MLLFSWLGYRFGRYRLSRGNIPAESSGAIIGAIFAILGLLIAFTFNGAFTRFDNRRQLIVQETNAIGTAYLRLDLLPESAQLALRKDFWEYTISRANQYKYLTDEAEVRKEYARTVELQNEIWAQAVAASSSSEYQAARLLLLPALNEMIDITTTSAISIQTHPPVLVWVALASLALASASMAGYSASSTKKPKNFYFITFAVIIPFIVYLMLDVEYPRYGIVRLDQVNQLLLDLAESMGR